MRDPRNEGRAGVLKCCRNFLADGARAAAYARLVGDIFATAPARPAVPDPPWDVLAYFEADGTCVAGIEIGALALLLDGAGATVSAIRLAGVAPSHRGRGLFRDLMKQALAICDARGDATLLYTEDDGLYSRFGFVELAQHAFVGPPPTAPARRAAAPLDRAHAGALIDRLGPVRAPVSSRCAVRRGVDLLQANLDDEDLRFALLDADTLLIYELDADELVVVDIVARTIPPLADIVGALGVGVRRVRTLFAPDRLGWDGTPVRDDTGLMVRGRLPPAMRRPFMLPPTTSF